MNYFSSIPFTWEEKRWELKKAVPNKASENNQNHCWNNQIWLNAEILVSSIYDLLTRQTVVCDPHSNSLPSVTLQCPLHFMLQRAHNSVGIWILRLENVVFSDYNLMTCLLSKCEFHKVNCLVLLYFLGCSILQYLDYCWILLISFCSLPRGCYKEFLGSEVEKFLLKHKKRPQALVVVGSFSVCKTRSMWSHLNVEFFPAAPWVVTEGQNQTAGYSCW